MVIDMVKEIAYAKINVALEVMDEKDGYHMVNNIMVPISLYDELYLEACNDIYIVDDNIKDNICLKAARLFLDYFNIEGGVKITLKKNIPTSAGLAGGSTDAAAVLKGLNKLYNVNAKNDELHYLAKQLGSDVPFFIDCVPALCTNKGEEVHPILSALGNIPILLIKPSIGLSTKLVYQNYRYLGVSKEDKLLNLTKAIKTNDKKLLINNIFNDLEATSLKLSKPLNDIYNILKQNYDVHISGSGPTMFILDFNGDVAKIKEELPKDTFVYFGKI